MQDNILQIMPAAGWVAVFDEEGEESAQGVVCFALVETALKREVRAMVAQGNARSERAADFETDVTRHFGGVSGTD